MAPSKKAQTKSIEVRFGDKSFRKCNHVRKFTFVPTDTADEIYDRIRQSFQPHVGANEIGVSHPNTGHKVDLQYRGFVNGGIYLLSVGAHGTHGAGHANSAAKRIKRAVNIAI
jgi:hypothetical protein